MNFFKLRKSTSAVELKEILVAVDHSQQAFKVVDQACEVAKGLETGIILVYVMSADQSEPEGVAAFEKAEEFPDAFAEYLEDLSEEVTSKLSERIKQAGIPCRAVSPSGNVAGEILEVAKVENAIMIVVGVRGLHGLARIRSLGSVARRVIENSTIPVLTVPS